MERVLQHVRRGLADPHALLRVLLLQHAVQRAPARAAAVQQLGRVSRWARGPDPVRQPEGGGPGGASAAGVGRTGEGGGHQVRGWAAVPGGRRVSGAPASPQCTAPGTSGPPGACAPAPAAGASGTARAPAGPPSSEATPARVPRSKPSSATSPCALVGEREGAGGTEEGGKGPGVAGQPQGPGWRLETLGHPHPCAPGIRVASGVPRPMSQAARCQGGGGGALGVHTTSWAGAAPGVHTAPSLPPPGRAVDGNWNEWSSWSACSASCAQGRQQRTRECNGPSYGGAECQGHWVESRDCFLQQCPGQRPWARAGREEGEAMG